MPTAQQEQVFNKKLEKIKNNKPVIMGRLMRDAGYSNKASGHPKRLIESKGWKELLADIQDSPLIDKLKEIALDDKDKRASISAITELMKLKDRYPANKIKQEVYEQRDAMFLDSDDANSATKETKEVKNIDV